MRKFSNPIVALITIGVVMIAFVVGLAALPTRAADHLDAPGLTSPGGDGRLDITDVYAFKSGSNTVLIMNVNPLTPTGGAGTFHLKASYEFLIDENGDAKPDTKAKIRFGKVKNGEQKVSLEIEGPNGEVEAEGMTGEDINIEGGGMLRADVFDDPFFFDLNAFLGVYPFCTAPDGTGVMTGDNFFTGFNVSGIVLEVPTALLLDDDGDNGDDDADASDTTIGVWARTVLKGKQIDRMGRPAINTVFIPSGSKNAFNAGKPQHDARDFSAFLGTFAGLLLPDILTIDTSSSAGFLNGRGLANDVIDAELQLITGNPAASDCVANDSAFQVSFPYLAPEN